MIVDMHTHTFPDKSAPGTIAELQETWEKVFFRRYVVRTGAAYDPKRY